MFTSLENKMLSLASVLKILLYVTVLFFLSVTVSFLISVQTREEVSTPHVVGKDIANAIFELQDYGLEVQLFASYKSSSEDVGTVLKQNPVAGTAVKQGRKVDLYIKKEQRMIGVPDLIGQSFNAAQNTVKTLNENSLADVYLQPPLWRVGGTKRGTVLNQYPQADDSYSGSDVAISLVLSLGTPKSSS